MAKVQSTIVSEGVNIFNQNIEDIIEENDNDGFIDDETQFEDQEVELQEEELQEEDFEGAEEPEEDSGDDPDYSDYSDAAILAVSLKADGNLPENFEINKDLTYSDLKDNYVNSLRSEFETEVNGFMESLGEVRKYVEYVINGGDPKMLQELQPAIQYSKVNIEDGDDVEDNRKKVIAAYYKEKGLAEDDITELIENYMDTGKDHEKAKEAVTYFKQKEDQMIQYEQAQRKAYEEQQRAAMEENQRRINELIEAGNIRGLKISKQDQKELKEAIFNPTEVIEYQDEDGKKKLAKVTKLQKLQYEFQQSLEQQLLFARLLLDGFQLDRVKETAREQNADEILRVLSQRRTQTTGGKSNRIQSKPVAEF